MGGGGLPPRTQSSATRLTARLRPPRRRRLSAQRLAGACPVAVGAPALSIDAGLVRVSDNPDMSSTTPTASFEARDDGVAPDAALRAALDLLSVGVLLLSP